MGGEGDLLPFIPGPNTRQIPLSNLSSVVREHTLSGSFCMNELILALGVEGLSFGGYRYCA
jgi:hypothetical protein